MKTAFFVRSIDDSALPSLDRLRSLLDEHGVEMLPWEEVGEKSVDFILSIGGDGTLLAAAHQTAMMHVPIVGVNFGHLGFLTTAGKDDVERMVSDLVSGNYSIEERTMLQVDSNALRTCARKMPLALNEVALHRPGNVSLLCAEVYVDGCFVSSYSADGLIVATPTGSTAYSLSCGGPILTPDCGCFVITPIAAHSLSLRPIIVPDSAKITLIPQGRAGMPTLSVDSEVYEGLTLERIELCRAQVTQPIVRLNHQHFFNALHEKLAL